MERLHQELLDYAQELFEHQKESDSYTASDYYEFLTSICDAMERHHGEEALAQMSDATILKVIRSQVTELKRFKRIDKLMRKRTHI